MNTKYPRTAKYDADWIQSNWMGPHPLWLLEDLCQHLNLQPGMRVLDMGCGKGITSIFLAKEYGVTVFANDLWINPTENLQRFAEAGIDNCVFPLRAEAHALPYAEGFFDVAISIDSYHYYGAGENYFPDVFHKLVKPGGQFGIVVPGLVREFENGRPDTLKDIWDPEYFTFHTAAWWQQLWQKTGLVEITVSYNIDNPKDIWYPWAKWSQEHMGFDDVGFLDADVNDDVALVGMVARKL